MYRSYDEIKDVDVYGKISYIIFQIDQRILINAK